MSRYIDADTLTDNLELMYEHRDDKDEPYNIGVRGAINMTRNAPTIEPKRGEWIDRHGKPMPMTEHSAYCSNCGEWSEYLTSYCGNCGADMREREGE